MKKILVAALVSLFAVSAMAVEVDFKGEHEITGYMIQNVNASDDSAAREQANWSGFYHWAILVGKLQVDPKTSFHFRAKFSDRVMGTNGPTGMGLTSPQDRPLDRVWAEYMVMDGLKVKAGRAVGRNYYRTFGAGFWQQTAEDSGTADLIRVDYNINNDLKVYAALEKMSESTVTDANGDNWLGVNGRDRDLYALGAELALSDDFKLYPVVTYYHDHTTLNNRPTVIAGYVAGEYLPSTGLNFKAAAAVSSDIGEYDNSDNKATLFGAYADAAYVMEDMKFGVALAYGSEDKDAGKMFSFGADWDRVKILDDGFRDSGDSLGGGLGIYAYGEISPAEKLTVNATVGIFMSMIDENSTYALPVNYWMDPDVYSVNFTDDTFAYEIDLSASYQVTDSTSATLGVAYAQINDVIATVNNVAGTKYDTDPIYMVWWSLFTEF